MAVYELNVIEVAVVGHYGCGMTGLSCARILDSAVARGIPPERIRTLTAAGIDLPRWLAGFDSPEDGVRRSVGVIRNHPLLPADVRVHGLMIDPETGRLDVLSDGGTSDPAAAGPV